MSEWSLMSGSGIITEGTCTYMGKFKTLQSVSEGGHQRGLDVGVHMASDQQPRAFSLFMI